jgi:peptidoglycan/xylan/chitin deacetylase (PgdA/CDA1 family)
MGFLLPARPVSGRPCRVIRGGFTALLVCGLLMLPSATAPAGAATPCAAGYVALTFDDGPSTAYTATIIDLLVGRQVPATFFVVGRRAAARPDLISRMARAGHEVANHTYDHERLTTLDDAAILRTVDGTDRAIRDADVRPLKLVRPPYGATSARVRATLGSGGYAHILWTVDPRDWESSAARIRSVVLGSLTDGAVILLHDGVSNSGETARALPGIIDGARDRGYCFAPLDDRGRLVREPPWIFQDVPPTSTHADAITQLEALGVVRGCRDGYYCPEDDVSRAQMASFLQRALLLPPGPTDRFLDVPADSAHAAAIGAVHEAGITLGCTEDSASYCPNDPIRRGQMASFLHRALGLPPGPVDLFRDVSPHSTHAAAIGAVYEAGVTRGCSDDGRSYCPGVRVSRAQMASFVVRALDHRGA